MGAQATTPTALYHPEVLAHAREPQRFGRDPDATHCGTGINALCGDKITIELQVEDHTINQYRFRATGCAICTATASLLGELVEGRTTDAAATIATESKSTLEVGSKLEHLPAIQQVVDYPTRIRCATLPLAALLAALQQRPTAVTTE